MRAKAKIRDDALPYELPPRAELAARVESALQVVCLIFNEGYAATVSSYSSKLGSTRCRRFSAQRLNTPGRLASQQGQVSTL